MKVFGYPGEVEQPGVRWLGGELPREVIASYYRHALAFVFPSLNEGFGMPILEAMASGCPVITSASTACSEVANGCAILVNPRSVSQMTAAMRQLMSDSGLRATFRLKGQAHCTRFDWGESTIRHATILRNCVEP